MERHRTTEAIERAALNIGLPVALHVNLPEELPIHRFYVHTMHSLASGAKRALEAAGEHGVRVLPYPNNHRDIPDP